MSEFLQPAIIVLSLLFSAEAVVWLGRKVNVSSIPVLLLLGVIAGPTALNLTGAPIIAGSFGIGDEISVVRITKLLAELGLIQLLFLVGVLSDLNKIKAIGPQYGIVALCSFLFSALLVITITKFFGGSWSTAITIAGIVSSTAISIVSNGFWMLNTKVKFFIAHNNQSENSDSKLNFEATHTSMVLPVAILSSLMIITASGLRFFPTHGTYSTLIGILYYTLKIFLLVGIAYVVMELYLKRVEKNTLKKRPWQAFIGFVFLLVLFFAWGAWKVSPLAALSIVYLGGVLFRRSKFDFKSEFDFENQLKERTLPFFYTLFIPVFFVSIGMSANFREVGSVKYLFPSLVGIVLVGKIAGSMIGVKLAEIPLHQGIPLGLRLLPQGEIGFILAGIALPSGVILPEIFPDIISVVIVITILAGLLPAKWSSW